LLANAKDEVDEHLLSELKINGLLRKPFEASMLKEQLSPFITLDENFGSEPYEDDEDFLIDMSTIDNQLRNQTWEKDLCCKRRGKSSAVGWL